MANAEIKYLQDEYASLIAENKYGADTASLFRDLQNNSSVFTEDKVATLKSAIELQGAASNAQRGQSNNRSGHQGSYQGHRGGYRPYRRNYHNQGNRGGYNQGYQQNDVFQQLSNPKMPYKNSDDNS